MPTKSNADSATAAVRDYLAAIDDPQRRQDCQDLCALLQKTTGFAPRMWGSAIVGFGLYHYRYDSGREGDASLVGFSARKGDISVYLMPGLEELAPLLARLGKHRAGKGCLYLKRLADVDTQVLALLVTQSVAELQRRYP